MAKSSVNKNTVFNTIKQVFGVIYPLITFPYISRVLLTDNVGKINFGNSIVSYFSLLASLGVTTYAVRECSKERGNKEELGRISSQIFSINIVSTLISYFVLAIVLLAAKPLENYRLLIVIQSSIILFSTLGADWVNTAMEDFKFIAVRTMSMQLVSLVLMFLFVHKPEDYMKYALISVISASGANIINIFYRRRFCRTRFTLNMDVKKHLPHILLLFSLILSQTIYVNSDMTILGLIKGDREVGLYSTSVKIYTIISTTIASVAWVVIPQLSFFFANKNYKEINRLVKYSLNFILVLGIPSICGLEVIAPHIINLIAGEAYADATISLRILSIAMLFSFFSGWIGNMTRLPAGKDKLSLKISSFSALLNIVLNFILIPIWGLNAAAFTTALSELFGMVWGLIVMDRNVRIEGLKDMLLGPFLGGLGIVAIGIVIQIVLSKSWLITIVTVTLSVIWYLVVMLVTKNEFFMSFAIPVLNRLRRNS